MAHNIWGQIQANWQQFQGQVKQKWGELTDDELTQISGQKDQLVGKIQEKYHVTKQEAENQVNLWAKNLD